MLRSIWLSICAMAIGIPLSLWAADDGPARLGNDTEAPPQRLALLIGNSKYEHLNALKNPKNDVDKLAAKLSQLGFQTTVKYDLNHDDFVGELATFTNKVSPGAIALFYYSGHGVQVTGGTNYLLPINLPNGANAVTLAGTGISLNLIRSALSSARLSVIILDACRTIGNFPAKGPVEGLAAFVSRGALVAYAADEGQTASDNDSEDLSLFTKHLINELDKPDELLCPLFTAVREAVDSESGHVQFPFVYDGVIGDFVFNRTTTAEAHNLVAVGQTHAWTAIQSSKNPNDYAAFLGAWKPWNVNYSQIAERRLSSLMSSTTKAVGVIPLDAQAPAEAIAIANQAERLFYETAYSDALNTYGKLLLSRSSDAAVLYDYGTCLLHLGRYDEAISFFWKAEELNKELPWTYLNRGVAFHLKGDLKNAITDYSKAVELRPSYAPGLNNLALAKRQAGDLPGADLAVKKAIEFDPHYAPAYYNSAKIHTARGDFSSATAYESRGQDLTVPKHF